MAKEYSTGCKLCSASFNCAAKWQEHRRRVEGEDSWQCHYCSFETITNLFLLNHLNEQHSSGTQCKHRCDHCDAHTVVVAAMDRDEAPPPSVVLCNQVLTAPGVNGTSQVITTAAASGVTEQWRVRFGRKRRPNLPDTVVIKRLRECPYFCEDCKLPFDSQQELGEHVAEKHK